jgi:hypothetical protein
VSAANTYTVVVHEVNAGAGVGHAYNLLLPGCAINCAPVNQPPVAKAHDVTVAAGPGGTANASVDNGSFDPDGDPITITQTPAGPYSVGTTSVLLTVVDKKGATAQASAMITVTPVYTLTVASTNPSSGVPITVSPPDNNGQSNGTTQFTRTYSNAVVVSLGAAASAGGKNFSSWTGCDSVAGMTCTATMNADRPVSANYGGALPALRFIPLAPCRIADTRNPNGPFGGPAISGHSSRDFVIPNSSCGVPATAAAYSLNVTVVPATSFLGYLTIWPTGQPLPLVSTLNSYDGRVKANAAIVPAGNGGAVSVYVTDTTHVILDINGYFVLANDPSAPLAFFPVTPCRLVDTRNPSRPLGGPFLAAQQARSFPVRSSSCNLPATALAYSLNFTAVPRGPLGYLTTWPTGMTLPLVSTLNALTGAVTANAAIVPAGTNGEISVYVADASEVIIDVNGYFAPPTSGTPLSLYPVAPCRVVDTRGTSGSFSGQISEDMTASPCGIPPSAQTVVLNATVVPSQRLGFLTLWPYGQTQPLVSTLNAYDGLVTSNMAIVPTSSSGVIDAFATDLTQLIFDTSGYFLSGTGAPPTMYTLTVARSGSGTGTVTSLDGKISCGAVCAVSYVSGAIVTLTASAASGSSFAGWSGGGCSGVGNCTVAVNSALSVTATFNSSSGSSFTGNWEFDTVSTAFAGVTSQVGGSIVQAGTAISGVLHVLGSSCFDVFTNVTVSGTILGNSVTITSGSVPGQVITFTGTATGTTLSGTYPASKSLACTRCSADLVMATREREPSTRCDVKCRYLRLAGTLAGQLLVYY